MKVQWRAEARADLRRIAAFIHERSPRGARRVTQRILTQTRLLRRFPMIGRESRARFIRELVISGTPYIVVYRFEGELVEVLNVFHGAQNR